MSLKDLLAQAKSLLMEDDGNSAAKAPATRISAVTPPSQVPHPAFSLPSVPTGMTGAAPALVGSPFSVPSTTVLDEKVYQTVLSKTNFNTTAVGKAVLKYYDALEGAIADQNSRFKAAIAQATKLDGITADQVLATFDQMQAALDQDAASFQKVADGVETNQITARQTRAAALQKQAADIANQITQLNTELLSETANHANAVQQYGLAQQRRAQEITAQKAQVASLLQR